MVFCLDPVVVKAVHFFKSSWFNFYSRLDMGIAMLHWDRVLEESGLRGVWRLFPVEQTAQHPKAKPKDTHEHAYEEGGVDLTAPPPVPLSPATAFDIKGLKESVLAPSGAKFVATWVPSPAP